MVHLQYSVNTDWGQVVAKKLWRQVEEKVDRIAEAVALMERGEFEFPDGKDHWTTVNGKREPRVIKKAALVYAGYAEDSQSVWANTFSEDGDWHPYYRERLAWHRQRLSGGYRQALAELTEGGGALRQLSKQAYEALMYKLKEPEKAAKEFSLKDLTKLYLDSTKLEASLNGEASTRREGPAEIQPSVLINIGSSLPEGYAERLAEQQQGYIESTAEEVVEGAV